MITITGPDTATGIWGMEDVHIYSKDDGPPVGHHGYGHCYENYVRTPEGWRFKRIEVVYDRVDALAGGRGPGEM